jgi:hypothetical protein
MNWNNVFFFADHLHKFGARNVVAGWILLKGSGLWIGDLPQELVYLRQGGQAQFLFTEGSTRPSSARTGNQFSSSLAEGHFVCARSRWDWKRIGIHEQRSTVQPEKYMNHGWQGNVIIVLLNWFTVRQKRKQETKRCGWSGDLFLNLEGEFDLKWTQ